MELEKILARWAECDTPPLAVDDGIASLTYQALLWRARDVATDLRALAGEGGPVLIEVAPSVAGATLFCAALLAGIPFCPLEPEDARHLTAVSLPRLFRGRPLVRLDGLKGTVVQTVPQMPAERGGDGEDIRAELLPPRVVLQLTSGTTAMRKVAVQPYANLGLGAETYCRLWQISPQSRVLIMVPIALSFGMIGGLLAAWHAGATGVLMSRPSLKRAWKELQTPETATVLASPLHYLALSKWAQRRGDRQSRRSTAYLVSGAPLPEVAATAFRELFGSPVRQIYGSTETGLIAAATEAAPPQRLGLVGALAPGVKVHIARSGGDTVPAESGGEVFVRTPTMFRGYLGHAGVAPPLGEHDFWPTGDLGELDAAGRLLLRGRLSSFVNVGGRKVHPETIEAVLSEHPNVLQALVYGEPCPRLGQRLAADVVVESVGSLDAIAEHCRSRLPAYQVPQVLRRVDHLEATSTGKIKRRPSAASNPVSEVSL